MKKSIISSIIFFLFLGQFAYAQEDFRKTAPKGGPAPQIELGEATTFKLDNGLQVIVSENNRLPRVSFQLAVDVPTISEGDKVGMLSFAGQLLQTGTTNRSKAEIDEAVDFIGASLSTSSTGMFGSCLTKHSDKLLDIMQDILYNPSFPQEEFDKIKQQTLSGLAGSKSNPGFIASRVSNVVRYGKNHPYGESQTEETVNNITVEDCKNYYNTYFKPNISYLVIVGDINPKKAKEIAEKYFSDWKAGDVPKEKFAMPMAPKERTIQFVNKPGAVQSVVRVTYPVDRKPGAKDAMASGIMNTILGGGFSSYLFKNLREDKGYTYGAGSSLGSDIEVASFTASADVRNEVTAGAITEFLNEMNRIIEEEVDEELLQNTKNYMSGGFARSLESPTTVASFALNTFRYKFPADYYQNYLKRLQAVTVEDIKAAAKKYIRPDNAHIVIVGDQEQVAESLKEFGPINFLDTYGNPVKAAASAGDMTAEQVIAKYLYSLGGVDKLKSVKDYTLEMEALVMGQTLVGKQIKKVPNKMAITMSVSGQVVNDTKFDGTKGSVAAMGQIQPMDATAVESMKLEARPFPEMAYGENGETLEIKGIKDVEKVKAYEIVITDKNGNVKTDYFAVDTGFKIRSVSVAKTNEQTITTTQDFKEYTEEAGVMFPRVIVTTGAMPFTLEMKVNKVSVNTGVADDIFEVKQ